MKKKKVFVVIYKYGGAISLRGYSTLNAAKKGAKEWRNNTHPNWVHTPRVGNENIWTRDTDGTTMNIVKLPLDLTEDEHYPRSGR